jgi:hypothetical protein
MVAEVTHQPQLCSAQAYISDVHTSNSGTRRRHEGAPPLVGESDLKPASELKP